MCVWLLFVSVARMFSLVSVAHNSTRGHQSGQPRHPGQLSGQFRVLPTAELLHGSILVVEFGVLLNASNLTVLDLGSLNGPPS